MSRPRLYLIARYGRREELCRYRAQLQDAGYHVAARWLHGGQSHLDTGRNALPHALGAMFAQQDMADLHDADLVMAFTESPDSPHGRGGRHVELGMALAWGKPIILVGPEENIFCALPAITRYPDFPTCLAALTGASKGARPCP